MESNIIDVDKYYLHHVTSETRAIGGGRLSSEPENPREPHHRLEKNSIKVKKILIGR